MEQHNDSIEYDMRSEIKAKLRQFFDGKIV